MKMFIIIYLPNSKLVVVLDEEQILEVQNHVLDLNGHDVEIGLGLQLQVDVFNNQHRISAYLIRCINS